MQIYTHALRCMVRDFGKEYDADPNGKYIEEKAAMCKLFSIYSTRIVSDGMLEIFGGDGYFEDSPYGPVERLYRDARAMWLEEGASRSPATARNSAASWSTRTSPTAIRVAPEQTPTSERAVPTGGWPFRPNEPYSVHRTARRAR